MKSRKSNDAAYCSACRSSYMTAEEIERERSASGWNPYWAEEEESTEEENTRSGKEDPQQGIWSPLMGSDPMLEGQRTAERDLRQLQFMYPETAKLLLPYIEDVCDKMEYSGSMMYDKYPDKNTVYRICSEIYENVKEQFPPQAPQERDEMLSMQYRAPRDDRDRPGRPGERPPFRNQSTNWVQDLIRVLLLNEMHHRRRRKKNLFN